MRKKELEEKVSWCEAEKVKAEERMNWYKEQWEKSIENDIVNTKHFLQITERIQAIIDENQSLSEHNQKMLNLLTVYSRLDPYILDDMRARGVTMPAVGPATLYLREIGVIIDGTKRSN